MGLAAEIGLHSLLGMLDLDQLGANYLDRLGGYGLPMFGETVVDWIRLAFSTWQPRAQDLDSFVDSRQVERTSEQGRLV